MSHPQVELHIAGYGVITLELDGEKAPKSTANFLDLSLIHISEPTRH